MRATEQGLNSVFSRLLGAYGEQHWWPAESRFEMILGAILTQNTSWTNAEAALANLRRANLLDADALVGVDAPQLAEFLRPSGYFNQKAKCIAFLSNWYRQQGGFSALQNFTTRELRAVLLLLKGIGPETADAILLYAFERPVFVIDAYTRRIFSRLGMVEPDQSYASLQEWFVSNLVAEAPFFNEYHALIVRHAKETCTKKCPLCEHCCLSELCSNYQTDQAVSAQG